jgi:hypothetical protein
MKPFWKTILAAWFAFFVLGPSGRGEFTGLCVPPRLRLRGAGGGRGLGGGPEPHGRNARPAFRPSLARA